MSSSSSSSSSLCRLLLCVPSGGGKGDLGPSILGLGSVGAEGVGSLGRPVVALAEGPQVWEAVDAHAGLGGAGVVPQVVAAGTDVNIWKRNRWLVNTRSGEGPPELLGGLWSSDLLG